MEIARRETEELFCFLLLDDWVEADGENTELILLLWESLHSLPSQPRFHINLDNYTAQECREQFRFYRADLISICVALRLPDIIHCSNGTTCSSLEAFLILCRRLSYPNRWCDVDSLIFHRSPEELSMIFNTILETIYTKWLFLLDGHNICLTQARMDRYANAISDKTQLPGLPIFGFVDGTLRSVCMPVRYQGSVYNGKDRTHGLKFQGVETPDGMIAHLHGPHPGYIHDANMFACSLIMALLDRILPAASPLLLYGDPAYPRLGRLIVAYRGYLTAAQEEWNRRVNAARVSVEWGFGKVIAIWAALDYKKNQKIFLQRVGMMYPVAVLLTNIHTVFYGSLTGIYFNLAPPTLAEYLDITRRPV